MTTDRSAPPSMALLDEHQRTLQARLEQTLVNPPALQPLEPVALSD